MADGVSSLETWFQNRGWEPLGFQRRAWAAYLAGKSGLIHAPTGLGKSLAAWGGPLLEALAEGGEEGDPAQSGSGGEGRSGPGTQGLGILWVTPLRALARDTVANLQAPLEDLDVPWKVEHRMGDTSASVKARQRTRMPHALVTTPESLSLLLSYPEAPGLFSDLRAVVVDEWHELMGSKRGVQTELALARLRGWRPGLRVWGLSATLGNLEEARDVLLGAEATSGVLIRGPERRPPEVFTLLPPRLDRFPWAGHLGLSLLADVVDLLDQPGTSLVFTNTPSQAELWFRALLEARPSWKGEVGLHHGSLDRSVRKEVEEGLEAGEMRAVVCTSTLDLGVDFHPVDRVVQIGSPKGVGRLLQRTGRSGHTPEGRSRVYCVPTHALELAEFAAVREAMASGPMEARVPVDRPLDVLVQHLVTVALGGGFSHRELLDEVRTTHAFRYLPREAWEWCLDFASRGGPALKAYPRYARIREEAGRWVGSRSRDIVRNHRMSIGTITEDGTMEVRFLQGQRLGGVEESFISRLRPGGCFTFAGRRLKLVRVRDMTAYVRLAPAMQKGGVPRWMGGRMPLSSELGKTLLAALSGHVAGAEMDALEDLLILQEHWSARPRQGGLLVERVRSREGHHLFLFPFQGRRVHHGLGPLLAYRLSRHEPRTFRISSNDYGIELLSREPVGLAPSEWMALLDPESLKPDLDQALNRAEMAKRHFREIARVAGLVFPGYPGRSKSARQLQASSGLVHDVFERYDGDNLLLEQTRREVLEREIEYPRLAESLARIQGWDRIETEPPRLTPLAFPIWAERIQAQVSSESWKDRVSRMAVQLEKAAERDLKTRKVS